MRHRKSGRKLSRTTEHRHALLRNLASSLIRTARVEEGSKTGPKVAGRIITTLAKAKEMRPYIEKLITMARKAAKISAEAAPLRTTAERRTDAYRAWRKSDQWQKWAKAISPAVAIRRRAFAELRDKEAVKILFSDLATRFQDRPGGYTRIVRLPTVRLGDAGQQAIIEFVGVRDRVRRQRRAALPASGN